MFSAYLIMSIKCETDSSLVKLYASCRETYSSGHNAQKDEAISFSDYISSFPEVFL
jgi:hypothetical protein